MIGWAAATGEISLASAALFALIFMWTPPHFWALALYRDGDYARAGVPMLPVVAGRRETKKQILIYTLALIPVALAPWYLGVSGWLYAGAAVLLSAWFTLCAVAVWRTTDDDAAVAGPAKRMFGVSILYLFGLFGTMVLDKAAMPLVEAAIRGAA
jgi:protoheme IX farnesyltransferase